MIVYELVATTLAAITLGYVCGITVSVLSIAIFHIIVELPMSVTLPIPTLIQKARATCSGKVVWIGGPHLQPCPPSV